MNKAIVSKNLRYICSEEYYYKKTNNLFTLYCDISEYKTFLDENISDELSYLLNTDLECVFIESRFGNGEYYDLVYKNCIDIVKEIINTL